MERVVVGRALLTERREGLTTKNREVLRVMDPWGCAFWVVLGWRMERGLRGIQVSGALWFAGHR